MVSVLARHPALPSVRIAVLYVLSFASGLPSLGDDDNTTYCAFTFLSEQH